MAPPGETSSSRGPTVHSLTPHPSPLTPFRRGPLIILSGPSGTGKTTVIRRLLAGGTLPLRLSVSATTRSPRPNERDGVDYHFWTPERFAAGAAEDAFLEHATVHGNSYGTLASEVGPYREQGTGVILDIDVQGAEQVRAKCPDGRTLFLRASGIEEYERRLRGRGTETEDAIRRRLANARRELAWADKYEAQVVNDSLDAAVQQVAALVEQWFYEGDGNAR